MHLAFDVLELQTYLLLIILTWQLINMRRTGVCG